MEHGYIYLYLLGSALFILGIKRLGRVKTARSANRLASLGMALAIVGAIWQTGALTWWMLLVGFGIGAVFGYLLATRIAMTQMPELVAAFNGFGGLASTLVATAEVAKYGDIGSTFQGWIIPVTILIGTLTFTGSFVAYFKLSGKKIVHPVKGSARHLFHIFLGVGAIFCAIWMVSGGGGFLSLWLPLLLLVAISGMLGWFLTLPIGGADMPVVVALLNSYSGLAAAASGFVISNSMLITAGALVGASGIILSRIMCKAMNRSLGNVLIGGIGDDSQAEDAREYSNIKETSAEEVAMLFDGASSVIVVPGYGLAVAQAQHAVRELADELEKRDVQVRYAIHPVAGRMPGHMNVLLAEADVPYEQLFELEKINADFKQTDVVIVTGANDVVNPAAREDKGSPIYGMPILDVDQAQTVVVIKRSLSPGYAGIRNPLFDADNCLMLFADAKQALTDVVAEVKEL